MHIQLDNGILVKIMWKNFMRKAQMNWLMRTAPKSVGISLAIYSPVRSIRWIEISCLLLMYSKIVVPFQLLKVPHLDMIETVDSIKLASELNKKWGNVSPKEPLNILVQVNTSQEDGTLSFSSKLRALLDIYHFFNQIIFIGS